MQREKSSHVQIITARQVYAQAVAEEQKHSQKFSGKRVEQVVLYDGRAH